MENRNQISRLKEGIGDLSTREYMNQVKESRRHRPNIKNHPSKGQVKNYKGNGKLKKVLACLATGLVIITAAGCTIGNHQAHTNEKPSTTYTENIEETTKAENEIKTVNDVKKDFTRLYLNAYNEKYGTNYSSAEMIVNNLRDGAVYKLEDGRLVTRGSEPDETEKALKEIGDFEIINGHNEVLQILSNGKILGTYNVTTGEFLYSAKQLNDLEKDKDDIPTLEELGINPNKLEAAGRVAFSPRAEGVESVSMRVKTYNNIPFENVEKTNDGLEIGD